MRQILYRVKHKIVKELKKRYRHGVPFQEKVAFRENGTNWYDPILAGPSTFVDDCTSARTVVAVCEIIRNLTPDRFVAFNLDYYRAGVERFGSNWRYADINTVLYGVSRNIPVTDYMEIGVRRGRSMAIVAALHPESHIVGFDLWIPNYAAMENPGPAFVEEELRRVGYRGRLELVAGNSMNTVPEYFRLHPDAYFDIVTVDGDHSLRGARIDLKNVLSRIKIGGFLVFDDICNPDHTYLRGVWDTVVGKSRRFDSYCFEELGYGVAFAIRKY